MKTMKTAIVYDWIDKWGGVERVLQVFAEMYPKADFYTSYYDREKAPWAKDLKIKTSFIQRFPDFIKKNRVLSLPFYPSAFESFNFSQYDLVISVTSSFAKGVITKPGTKHICYLLTPTRFLWSHSENYWDRNPITNAAADFLRDWDLNASRRPDKIISISNHVAKRTKKYYQRESVVVYPPFDEKYWDGIKLQISKSKFQTNPKYQILNTKYYLIVSRLERYKKVDLAIKVFNKINKPLVIIGTGTQEEKLKELANPNITFIKNISDEELGRYYQRAEALIMPQDEDFGMVTLEALYFGCPIISYKNSGVSEIVDDNKTGLLFAQQTEKSLTAAIERYGQIAYNVKQITKRLGSKRVQKFSKKIFIDRFRKNL